MQPITDHLSRKHHIRRGHTCKATQRQVKPVRLRAGWCISERRYRPKFCGACSGRCCSVYTSTTISIAFLCPLHANTDLLAAPHASHPVLSDPFPPRPRLHAQTATTNAPSVYDMMDEGQPVLESVLTYPQPQLHTQRYSHNSLYQDDPADDDYQNKHDDLDDQPSYEHENLTVDDDLEYDDIKSDNYEVVHYQLEWIMRCKCSVSCETQDSAKHTLHTPSLIQEATTTPT
ncbi:uncharacterized protein [Panulirus ornatus]|uniref:uncharacterized protein n=1 Tax=Panulirus ornatus TaxID=150431 RepID=UPI003A848A80